MVFKCTRIMAIRDVIYLREREGASMARYTALQWITSARKRDEMPVFETLVYETLVYETREGECARYP